MVKKSMSSNSRRKDINCTILEIVEQHGTETNKLLYSQLNRKFPDLEPCEFSAAIDQLQTLEMMTSFDGGHDRVFVITRKGACALVQR